MLIQASSGRHGAGLHREVSKLTLRAETDEEKELLCRLLNEVMRPGGQRLHMLPPLPATAKEPRRIGFKIASLERSVR